uniref:Peptidase C39-like domain-containing protein n=1 Tax=Euplotes harpa TaxID=151035 RepID=A0A7S3JKB5_9SPIT|mmetsp:Transcript_41211/g.47464  ORF Transcript_41211/g.47464 Transcript_41211/m.47464 type:complete len:207 (+) Transcript_41211:1-621(+)
MKAVLLLLLLVTYVVSNSLVQESLAELPLSEQHEPEEDFFDYTLNFLKGYFAEPNTCDVSRTLFKQCDGAWGSIMISDKTLCQVGCLISSVSMFLNSRGKSINGASANPSTLLSWLKSHGGLSGNLFVWGSVGSLGATFVNHVTSTSEIQKYICDTNYEVVLNVNGGGHYVLATGYTSTGYSVNDPGFSKSSYGFSEVTRASIFRV